METIHETLKAIVAAIQLIAVAVLLWGAVRACKDLVDLLIFAKKRPKIKHPILLIKIGLGRYILLGLEFLIVADIIDSVLDPTWEGTLMLAAIVAIRTVISFFLNHEISETDEKIIERDEEEIRR